jgi:hypothetical protein
MRGRCHCNQRVSEVRRFWFVKRFLRRIGPLKLKLVSLTDSNRMELLGLHDRWRGQVVLGLKFIDDTGLDFGTVLRLIKVGCGVWLRRVNHVAGQHQFRLLAVDWSQFVKRLLFVIVCRPEACSWQWRSLPHYTFKALTTVDPSRYLICVLLPNHIKVINEILKLGEFSNHVLRL